MKIFKTIILLFFGTNLFSQCPPDLQVTMLTQTLTCNNPTILATASSTTPNTVIYWLVPSTPSMIISPSIIVGPPNGPATSSLSFIYANYTAVVTNTVMMCNSSSPFMVNQNFVPASFTPVISQGSPTSLCNSPVLLTQTVTQFGPLTSLYLKTWEGPSPQVSLSSVLAPIYTCYVPGTYSLSVVDPFNGCSFTKTINVTDSRPQFGLQGSAPTSSANCNGSVIVTTQIPNGYSLSATSGSLNGTTLSNLCYGWVKVCMTYTNSGCFKCDSILMNAATSLNEIDLENEILIYPNPTSSSFFIKNTSNKNFSVKIFDLEGSVLEVELVETGASSPDKLSGSATGYIASALREPQGPQGFEIKNLVPGIYFIEIRSEKSVLRKKLIINP